jgi:hypothetical protein
MGVTEASKDRASGGDSQQMDQFPPKNAEGNGIEKENSLAGERNDPALGPEVQEFMDVEIGCAHEASKSF